MKRKTSILKYIITGTLVFVIPLLTLIVLFSKGLRLLMPLGHSIAETFHLKSILGSAAVMLVCVFLMLLISLVFGYLILNGFLKQWGNAFETTLFYHFPSFQMMKYRFIEDEVYYSRGFWQPVLLKEEQTYRIAFITDKSIPDILAIFVPDAPRMDAGEVRYISKSACEYLPISMKQAMNGLRNFGQGMESEVFFNQK